MCPGHGTIFFLLDGHGMHKLVIEKDWKNYPGTKHLLENKRMGGCRKLESMHATRLKNKIWETKRNSSYINQKTLIEL